MKLKHEAKVGVFVLVSLIILAFLILWINRFEVSAKMNIYAKFEDAGTLGSGANVLYRGVNAGSVESIAISKDQQHAIVHIKITNDKIHLYKGSTATIVDKGFTGSKALIITPPKTIADKELIKDGDVLPGKQSFNYEEMQKLLTDLIEKDRFKNMIIETEFFLENINNLADDMEAFLANANDIMGNENKKELESLIKNANILSRDLQTTSNELNQILTDDKFKNDVKSAVSSTDKAMKQFDKTVEKTDKVVEDTEVLVSKADELVNKTYVTVEKLETTVEKADNTINNPEMHGSIRDAMKNVSDVMSDLKGFTGDPETQKSLKDYKTTLTSFQCFSEGMSRTFSKRFLIPRMTLGRPGKSLSECFAPSEETTKEEQKEIDE
jgi:virulence factor Mce-like protein